MPGRELMPLHVLAVLWTPSANFGEMNSKFSVSSPVKIRIVFRDIRRTGELGELSALCWMRGRGKREKAGSAHRSSRRVHQVRTFAGDRAKQAGP